MKILAKWKRISFAFLVLIVGMPSLIQGASNRPAISSERQREGGFIDGTYPGIREDELRRARNFQYLFQGPHVSQKRGALNADQGNIAVIEDDGTVLLQPNTFDLDNGNIRFTPSGSSFLVSRVGANFDPAPTAAPLTGLGDDDARQIPFSGGFTFPFFGQVYSSVFVNSDGNLTFGSSDTTSDDRDVDRFLSRQPRIGPFFSDLDPSCSGTVSTEQRSDRIIVLWSGVTKFVNTCSSRDSNTFEVILFLNGTIEFSYNGIQTQDSGVGVAPGNNQGTPPAVVDYTTLSSPTPEVGAVIEFFSLTARFSNHAVAKKFYQTHGDDYDFITVFTNFSFPMGGAFAFEVPVSNDATGIGLPRFNDFLAWGSRGRLQSFLNMGPLNQYPSDPQQIFLGTNSTVEVMGQEFGHRWMAFVDIPGGTCKVPTFSNTILGRDCAHWNFFFNSTGSVMEGNDILDGGVTASPRFMTTANATSHYSELDQYLMGFRAASEVQPMFVVFNPTGTSRRPSSSPAANITFNGMRNDFTIQDIINHNSLRTPMPDTSQKLFRQAWIFLVARNTTPTAAELAKIESFRQAWQSFFSAATNGGGSVDTILVSSNFNAQLPASLGVSRSSSSQGPLTVTYGQVSSTTPSLPVVLSIFGLTQNGVLVTEAGIPAVNTTTAAEIFVDSTTGQDSGVAIVNPGDNPNTINFTVRDSGGAAKTASEWISTNVTLPAHGKIAKFVSELGLNLPNPFLGTMTLTSSTPFAAVNLRSATNAHNEIIFSALPVADLTRPPSGSNLIFPQVVDGGGVPEQILLMSSSSTVSSSGTISFFDNHGDPVALNFGSGPNPSIPYSMNANGMQKFSTNGAGSLKVAYAVVTPTMGPLPVGAAIFSSNNLTGGLTSQAGVLNAIPTTFARMYIEVASSPLTRKTGLALVNRNGSSTPATVNLNLVSLDGLVNLATTLPTISGNGKTVKLITEMFPGQIPADFRGMLTLTSNVPIAVVTLRQTKNQRDEDIFSTLPVADLNNPPQGPLIIPQAVSGGGYETQIVGINTSNSGGTLTINFFNELGGVVGVPLQ